MKLSPTAAIPSLSSPSSARRAPDVAPSGVAASDARAVALAASKKTPVAPTNRSAPARPATEHPTTTREAVVERKPKTKRDDDNQGAPKKRVRLKPETPEQLIERLRNPQLSLHEASILLRVSRATVRRYADAGRLNCQRTPGGQRRFFLRDIENFYRQLKLKR